MRADRDSQAVHAGITSKRRATLEADLGLMLDELCTGMGFCNHLTAEELLRAHPLLTADDFAAAVLKAEGFPDHEVRWRRIMKRLFNDRYGASVSRAAYRQQRRR